MHNGVSKRNADEKVEGEGDPQCQTDIDTGIRGGKRSAERRWNSDVGSASTQNRKKKRIALAESTEIGDDERAAAGYDRESERKDDGKYAPRTQIRNAARGHKAQVQKKKTKHAWEKLAYKGLKRLGA